MTRSVVDSSSSVSDEVHLILEYAAGDATLGFNAPRANRFIVSSDRSNGKALTLCAPRYEILLFLFWLLV